MGRASTSAIRVIEDVDRTRVIISRPDHYNALDIGTLAELSVTIDALPRRHLPLVLEGEGRVFCLGADVRELANFTPQSAATYSRLGQQTVAALEAWPSVTVANLRGYALGTGLELALGCDVLAAEPGVRLGLPGLVWALVPCLGGMRRLAQRVGTATSSELLLRGLVLNGQTALAAGLVDRLVESPADLDRLIAEIGEFSPAAVAAIRDLRLRRHGPIDALAEAEMFAQPFASGECQRRLRNLL